MQPFPPEALRGHGPVLRDFMAALLAWERDYDALGKHKAVGHWRLPRRRRRITQAQAELNTLAAFIGSIRRRDVILRFGRPITGYITGRSDTISFPAGSFVIAFESQPVVDEHRPFNLRLRFILSRYREIGEITLDVFPGDIDSLYELPL